MVEYGSPKEYQVPSLSDDAVSAPLTKKRFQCKKLKGKHDFVRMATEPVRFLGSEDAFVYLKCRGCMKSKIKIMGKEELQKEINASVA